jgi:uncharacterized protein DUF695
MFGWFKKPAPPAPALQSDARDWANMQGEMGGMPVFIRIRTSLRDRAIQANYGHQVSVEIAFHELRENGLPCSEKELTAVDQLEDWLVGRLESFSPTLLGLVITGDGARVCYFYTADPAQAIALWEQQFQPHIRSHQVTFQIRPDPGWEMYRRFLG